MAAGTKGNAHEWLELVERSGLVVSEVPLHRHFPYGPPPLDRGLYQHVVGRWERFRIDPEDPARRLSWDAAVTADILGWPQDRLLTGGEVPEDLRYRPEDLEETLAPMAALLDGAGGVLMGVWGVPAFQGLDRVERKAGRWRATPQAKAERWMRGAGVRLTLLTNGTRFRLIQVPPGLPAGWIEFDAGQWVEERQTLAAFRGLLAWDRIRGEAEPGLTRLLEESEREQTELTDRLGQQVRNAVEYLILALDQADHRAGRKVLGGLPEDRIYEAAVFVVMRMVFLLFAEERSLLPHGNVFYDEAYGVGRLMHRLQEERRLNPDIFKREADAWPRLLALFRLVFEGSLHPDLNLPAYGGDLFDPRGSRAIAVLEDPRLRIPNRAVYRILRSLTMGEAKVGREKLAQRFSYRTLDVEHIGYVYEGLLDHRAARAGTDPMVKLRNGTEEGFDISQLESRTEEALVRFLKDHKVLGGDEDRIRRVLAEPEEDALTRLGALSPDTEARCRPFAGVIQTDKVVEPGHLFLTTASSRRATGTHYTPIQYTRAMVGETLEPLVYMGENGKLEEPLSLRSPRELLALKVGDPAMGSGAFLVQVVRYLGEKLTDAWYAARTEYGEGVPLFLPYAEPGSDREDRIPLPPEREEADLWARRFVAERCIYGVDKNALAVEMAKLSVWLVTLSRDKPFSFLDHALRSGDSLVGLSNLDQLRFWNLAGTAKEEAFEKFTLESVEEAVDLRRELEEFPVVDASDVEAKARLLAKADEATEKLRALGDLLFGPCMATDQERKRQELWDDGLFAATHRFDEPAALRKKAQGMLGDVNPFHWPLEFPEVFEAGGFHALVGNPPFMGGKKLTGEFGQGYREYLVTHLASGIRGVADLVAYFFLRAHRLLRPGGGFGLLAVNTISEGDTRQVGLEQILQEDAVISASHPNERWPNDAAVVTSRVHVRRGPWEGGCFLSGKAVKRISGFLSDREDWSPERLLANANLSFQGSVILGTGFLLAEHEATAVLKEDPSSAEVLYPFLNGRDLNQDPEQRPSRWVINFWDWPESRARRYTAPFRIVEERVRPERIDKHGHLRTPSSRRYLECWWQFARPVPACYHAIGRGHTFLKHPAGWDSARKPYERVIVAAQTSKFLSVSLLPNRIVFSQALVVFAGGSSSLFAMLNSSIHFVWVEKNGSKMKRDLRYIPTDCFETFPFPDQGVLADYPLLRSLGVEFHELRAETMKREWIGLTDLYNRLHDPGDRTEGLDRLRELQVAIDRRVLELYGWQDIELGHDFRDVPYLPENDRRRFAISEEARLEILDRLGRLNRQRYEEEVEAGLHDKQKSKQRKAPTRKADEPPSREAEVIDLAAARKGHADQPSLFDIEAETAMKVAEPHGPPPPPLSAPEAILEWLIAHPGWHTRARLTQGARVPQNEWQQAIAELLDAGLVQRTGERRGTRYRALETYEETDS